MLEFYDVPVETEADLLVLVAYLIVGTLQVVEELLRPLESGVPRSVLERLLHALSLLLRPRICRVQNGCRDSIDVIGVN